MTRLLYCWASKGVGIVCLYKTWIRKQITNRESWFGIGLVIGNVGVKDANQPLLFAWQDQFIDNVNILWEKIADNRTRRFYYCRPISSRHNGFASCPVTWRRPENVSCKLPVYLTNISTDMGEPLRFFKRLISWAGQGRPLWQKRFRSVSASTCFRRQDGWQHHADRYGPHTWILGDVDAWWQNRTHSWSIYLFIYILTLFLCDDAIFFSVPSTTSV